MKTKFHRPLAVVLAIVLSGFVAGCQSAPRGGANEGSPNAPGVAQPRPIVVRDFAFDEAGLRTDPGLLPGRDGPGRRLRDRLHSPQTPAQEASSLASLLSETIVRELSALRIPASRQPKEAPWPDTGLGVKGEFLRVDEGNRLQRAVIGFGAGASEVKIQVEVFDLAQDRHNPILIYGTGKETKPAPGGIVMKNPYAMAAKYVLSRNVTEKEVRALGKQIAHDLARIEADGAPQR